MTKKSWKIAIELDTIHYQKYTSRTSGVSRGAVQQFFARNRTVKMKAVHAHNINRANSILANPLGTIKQEFSLINTKESVA